MEFLEFGLFTSIMELADDIAYGIHDLEDAISLKQQNIPFKWGGKTQSEGFDSSGFVAYLLHKHNIIKDNYKAYWSGKIREEFPSTNSPKVGDLIFYQSVKQA